MTSLFWFPQVTNFPITFYRNVTLRPNEMTQRDILAGAVSELLWKVHFIFFVTIDLENGKKCLDWRRLRCGGCYPRGESSIWSACKVFHRRSDRKSKFDEKTSSLSMKVFFLIDHYFQLHLFKCSKEEELRNLVKKHIYFVSHLC